MCSGSGNGGPGGTVRNAKKPVSSSGCAGRNSRYHASTSAAASIGQRIGPAMTVDTGCSWSVNAVTTPKFPPPPRIAQKRSAFSSSLARTKVPSASTTSAARTLSIERPCFRVRWPTPPPSRSPTPVVPMIPTGMARPNGCVAWSMSPSMQPPPTCAVRPSGSTLTQRIGERSSTRPSSTVPKPAPLCPAPRTAMSSPFARPNASAACTSAMSRHRATTAGRLSIIAL